jgi:cystathionine beta-lyase/cystathionine gamma-synthase
MSVHLYTLRKRSGIALDNPSYDGRRDCFPVLGGVESPIEHPVTMMHASVAPDVLREMGITPDLVRISVGIEDVEDLIGDLRQALNGV